MDPSSARPGVAVIIVNWNDAADTIACLDSLARLRTPAGAVYVVDNASDDGSAAAIRLAHPEAALIQAPRNLGYAGGFNLGRVRALADGAEYLWLLNNDAAVEPTTLDRLVQAARRHGPAIYSPLIARTDDPGRLWYAGGTLDWRLKSHHLGVAASAGAEDAVRPIAWATGCSLFCPAAVARRVGPMDERYFLYLEDVDWCLAARAAGIPTLHVPAARITHGVSRSVARLDPGHVRYYAWRNYYLLVRKHGAWWQRAYARANLAARFTKIGLRSALVPAARRDPLYRARTRGLVDFLHGRFGPAAPGLTGRGLNGLVGG